jgi:hypothetical protein
MKTKLLVSLFLFNCVLHSFGQLTWIYDSLSQPRNNMGAASFGTRVYFGGGETELGNSAVVEIYEAETGTWDSPDNLSVGRSTLSATALDSLVFFAGGFEYATGAASSVVDILDTRTGQWSVAQLSIPRFAISAVSNNHEVLFAGGLLYDLTGFYDVDIFNTQTGTWYTDYLSEARGAMAAAVVGDKAIFAGGLLPGADVTNIVDIYNFTTSAWTTAHLSQARSLAVATTVGNKVLIAGGMTAGFANPSKRVDIYDAETDTWTTANLSVARTCNAVTINGKAYFAGGGTFGSGAVITDYSNVIDIYDPVSDTWTVDYLPQPLATFSMAGIGNRLIIAGGMNEGDLRVKTVEISDVVDGISSPKNDDAFFRTYPNPSSGNLHLEILKEDHKRPLQATIYNLQGQVVSTQTLEPGNMEMNLELTAGLYLLRLIDGDTTYSEMITIQ